MSLDKLVDATFYYFSVVWHYFKQALRTNICGGFSGFFFGFFFCITAFHETLVICSHCREMSGVMTKGNIFHCFMKVFRFHQTTRKF